jgi:probable F420-dependent oxidoreductase
MRAPRLYPNVGLQAHETVLEEAAMKVETLLPLGKTDPGLRASDTPLDLTKVYDEAQLVESLGYDSLCVEETKTDPYIVMALAGQATTRLGLTTAVAMAFPRSPTITAMSAWNLQKLSSGRFTLGLGTQVKGHIRRRFGMEYSPSGPWIRDYVRAVRAVWDCWQHRTKLDYEGEHYRLNLMVPLFDPGPIEHANIPIHLAAVNRYMCRVAGEVANGVRPHPICTPSYIERVMLPEVWRGAEQAGRDPSKIDVCIKPLIATAPDLEQLEQKIRDVRARVAFYASTPSYRAAFEHHGLGDLASELQQLSRVQRWEEMPSLISDEVLHLYATVGTYGEIVDQLYERYGRIITNAEFSVPVRSGEEREHLADLVRELQSKRFIP